MVQDRLTGKLAVILHADVAGSTQMVQQDEHLAHERIQDTFQRFSATIEEYSGQVLELRGDALLAEFERPSDALSATLAFQSSQSEFLSSLNDDLRPELRAVSLSSSHDTPPCALSRQVRWSVTPGPNQRADTWFAPYKYIIAVINQYVALHNNSTSIYSLTSF